MLLMRRLILQGQKRTQKTQDSLWKKEADSKKLSTPVSLIRLESLKKEKDITPGGVTELVQGNATLVGELITGVYPQN